MCSVFVSVISDIILVDSVNGAIFLSGYTLLMYFLKNINVVLLLLFIIVQLSNNAKQHEN